MANIACRIFQEQLDLIKELPEKERATVLYTAVCNAFNQFDYQNDFQNENQNENAYVSVSVSVSDSVSVLGNTVIKLLSKSIVCKEFSNNYGGKRTNSGRPSKIKNQFENQIENQTDIQIENQIEKTEPKKRFTLQSQFRVNGQDFDEFPAEALPLLKKHWSSKEIERIRKDLTCKPEHNTSIEQLLQEYPSDILPYKYLGEKKSIPLTKKQWDWFQQQSITPAVKVKAIDILENYALSHPDKFKKFTDPSLIIGRKSGWAFVEAFEKPYQFENQEELIAELKRVGLR